jgi:hypothetical protein
MIIWMGLWCLKDPWILIEVALIWSAIHLKGVNLSALFKSAQTMG